jgi:arginyl-tRNA synthetase
MENLEIAIQHLVEQLYGVVLSVAVTKPDAQFGDAATNIALRLATHVKKSPTQVASELLPHIERLSIVSSAAVAGPGFLNIRITDDFYITALAEQFVSKRKNKTVVVEYSCPNYFKELHAGHLYNTIAGDVIARLLERDGATVIRTTFGGDVGLHVAKCLYGMLVLVDTTAFEAVYERMLGLSEAERPTFLSGAYVKGSMLYETDEAAKTTIDGLNKAVYACVADSSSSALKNVYEQGRQWSKEYFVYLYDWLEVAPFDRYFKESETAHPGKELVLAHTDAGSHTFTLSDGATVFRGEVHDLHTRVFITKQDIPTYETKDIGVMLLEQEAYQFDERVLLTGNDQSVYMQVVWKAFDLVQPGTAAKMKHVCNGTVRFGDGQKMSSRLGNVTRAVDILETVSGIVSERQGESEQVKTISLAAVKYEFLKYRLGGDIAFDPKGSVSLEGNSGPYLQYALVRARAIKQKAQAVATVPKLLESGERQLLVKMTDYPLIVRRAIDELAPHHICTYLYELAQEFNRFYEKCPVINSSREAERVYLVENYVRIVADGLSLLGIAVPKVM